MLHVADARRSRDSRESSPGDEYASDCCPFAGSQLGGCARLYGLCSWQRIPSRPLYQLDELGRRDRDQDSCSIVSCCAAPYDGGLTCRLYQSLSIPKLVGRLGIWLP